MLGLLQVEDNLTLAAATPLDKPWLKEWNQYTTAVLQVGREQQQQQQLLPT